MGKKGGSKHFVRMRAHKRLGVVSRKRVKWLLAPMPGTHGKTESISAGVLLRDVLSKAANLREAKKILNSGALLIDGKKVHEPKFPVGLMDIISEPAEGKAYRMSLSGPKLVPKAVEKEASQRKYLKVAGKHTLRGGKLQIAFHDGRTYLGDKGIRAGDTCVFSVPEFKLVSHMKFAQGARCLVTQGKHIGELATLDKVIERPGSQDAEVQLAGTSGQFVTLVKYLFVVDEKY